LLLTQNSSFKIHHLLLVKRSRPGVNAAHARLIDDTHLKIVHHAYLTGEADILGQFCFHRQAIALGLTNFAGVAREHFDAAGCAFGVAAATMKDVYPGVFDCQHELTSLVCVKSL
jgi:hypothetical protein